MSDLDSTQPSGTSPSASSGTSSSAATGYEAQAGDHLSRMSVEIICQILRHLGLNSTIALTMASKRFRAVVLVNFRVVMGSIYQRQLAPADRIQQLVQVYTTTMTIPVLVLSHVWVDALWLNDKSDVPGDSALCFQDGQLGTLRVSHAIQKWAAIFPALRFAMVPSSKRSLTQEEMARLHVAIGNWWQYAIKFHGAFSTSPFWHRTPDSPDVRVNFMRSLSTSELVELQDLWMTLRHAVQTQLVPSILRVRAATPMSFVQASEIAWGVDYDNDNIVDTIMKLPPDDLLHIFESRHQYTTRAELVVAILARQPDIESSMESLGEALDLVLWRRQGIYRMMQFFAASRHRSFPAKRGGILDFGRKRVDRLRAGRFGRDAGFTMHVPDPTRFYQSAERKPGQLMPPPYF